MFEGTVPLTYFHQPQVAVQSSQAGLRGCLFQEASHGSPLSLHLSLLSSAHGLCGQAPSPASTNPVDAPDKSLSLPRPQYIHLKNGHDHLCLMHLMGYGEEQMSGQLGRNRSEMPGII